MKFYKLSQLFNAVYWKRSQLQQKS